MDDAAVRFRDWPVPWEVVAVLGFAVGMLVVAAVRGEPLGGALFANAVVWLTVTVLASLPRGMSGRRVTVRDEGLRVGFWSLPAEAIGDVAVLSPREARVTGASRHHGEHRIHLSTANRLTNSLGGVAVEDLRHDEPKVWIVTTRHPEDLLAALDSIRRDSRAGAR